MKRTKLKKSKNLAFLLFLGTALTSCVNNLPTDKETIGKSNIPIQLSTKVQVNHTRVTNTSFEVDDAIGLYVLVKPSSIKQTRYVDNMRFVNKESKIFEPDETIFFPEGNKPCDFISYYPYKANCTPEGASTCEIAVHPNQESDQNHSESNFMVANSTNISATEESIELLFKNKLTRLNILLKTEANYTIEELLAADPVIKIKDINTKATYDFLTNKIESPNTIGDVTPHGSWSLKEDVLSGKSVIVIPQKLIAPHVIIELHIGENVYECTINEDFEFKSGSSEDLTLTLLASTKGVQTSINPSIEGWGESNPNNMDASEVSTSIHLSDLSFANSNVYKVMNKGKQVAEICKEYLRSSNIDAQAIVAYPITDDIVDLKKGVVCQIVGEPGSKHGGKVTWDKTTNQLTYVAGNAAPVEYLFITAEKTISTARTENALQLQVKPDILVDTRGDETINYPIVKIGTQYWTRGNLRATKYANGSSITLGSDFSEVVPQYCQPNAYYYFYNSAAIAHQSLAPANWRISSVSDWGKLKTYIDNNASALKNGALWGDASNATNITGFNAVATGVYSGTSGLYNPKGANGEGFTYYWCVDDTNPQATAKMIGLLGFDNNNTLNDTEGKNRNGAGIRLLKR